MLSLAETPEYELDSGSAVAVDSLSLSGCSVMQGVMTDRGPNGQFAEGNRAAMTHGGRLSRRMNSNSDYVSGALDDGSEIFLALGRFVQKEIDRVARSQARYRGLCAFSA